MVLLFFRHLGSGFVVELLEGESRGAVGMLQVLHDIGMGDCRHLPVADGLELHDEDIVRCHRLLVSLLEDALILGLLHDVANAADAQPHGRKVNTIIPLFVACAQSQRGVLYKELYSRQFPVETSTVKRSLSLKVSTVDIGSAVD